MDKRFKDVLDKTLALSTLVECPRQANEWEQKAADSL